MGEGTVNKEQAQENLRPEYFVFSYYCQVIKNVCFCAVLNISIIGALGM